MRSFTQRSFVLAFLFLLITGPKAFAIDPDILQAENAFSIGTGLIHFAYGETAAGFPGYLDTENGDLNTTTFDWSGLADDNHQEGSRPLLLAIPVLPGSYFSGQLIYANGATAYDGHTLSGIPVSTTDTSMFLKGYLALGTAYSISQKMILIPSIVGGVHYWRRIIEPNSIFQGVNHENVETYRHFNGGFGLQTDFRILEGGFVSLGVDFLRNFNSNMTSSQIRDTFWLGNSLTYRLKGKITYEAGKNINFFGGVHFETFTYGRSPTQDNGFYEPDSKSSLTLYSVGAAYAY